MHKIYVAALAEMMKEYGLTVCATPAGPELVWGLYVQGSGVAFSADVTDFRHVAKVMHEDGNLVEAALLKDLIDNHGLSFSIRQRDHRASHAYTMDIETSGPTSESGVDFNAMVHAIELASNVLRNIREQASMAAQRLLEDWFAIAEVDLHVRRVYTTRHFKVEVIKSSGSPDEDLLAHDLEYHDPAEALGMMRNSIQQKDATSYRLSVTVSHRSNPSSNCACCWKELSVDGIPGGVFTEGDVRDVIKLAIQHARSVLQSQSTDLKEAA